MEKRDEPSTQVMDAELMDEVRRLCREDEAAALEAKKTTSSLVRGSDVPRLAVPVEGIEWHSLDHQASFLLRRVDGERTFEQVVDGSGITFEVATQCFEVLRRRGYIE